MNWLKSLFSWSDKKKIERLHMDLATARSAQGAQDIRIAALRREYPDIWREFFTREGEAKRSRS